MRIAILTDKCGPRYIGGYETRWWNLARCLAATNEVAIYTCADSPSEQLDGVTFIRYSTTFSQPPAQRSRSLTHSCIFALNSISRSPTSWKPDVIIAEAIPYLHLWGMARWARRCESMMALGVEEAWDRYSYRNGLLSTVSRIAIRRLLQTGLSWSSLVLAPSLATATSLAENYGAKGVEVIPNGVDFGAVDSARQRFDGEIRYDFISVGRLVANKRIGDLIRATEILRDRYDWSPRVAIIGDGPERRPLLKLIDNLGLGSQVSLFPTLSSDELFDSLTASRFFVLPSEREGFSVATLEALACGLPSIVAQPSQAEVFGVSDIVHHDQNGFYTPVGDPPALAAAMHKSATDGNETKMKAMARESAVPFAWDKIASRLESVLLTSLSSR
jgi:glycosyltransferase involved in cell wall biosynthesis